MAKFCQALQRLKFQLQPLKFQLHSQKFSSQNQQKDEEPEQEGRTLRNYESNEDDDRPPPAGLGAPRPTDGTARKEPSGGRAETAAAGGSRHPTETAHTETEHPLYLKKDFSIGVFRFLQRLRMCRWAFVVCLRYIAIGNKVGIHDLGRWERGLTKQSLPLPMIATVEGLCTDLNQRKLELYTAVWLHQPLISAKNHRRGNGDDFELER